jgi:transcriptional regulator with XRE-family HTH domain
VDIGKRFRELRESAGLSQRDVEDLTGLPQAYVSKTENGHGTPTLEVLERWAEALDVDLHQLFAVGHGQAETTVQPGRIPAGAQERKLLGLFSQMSTDDKSLLVSLAREMVKRNGKRG